ARIVAARSLRASPMHLPIRTTRRAACSATCWQIPKAPPCRRFRYRSILPFARAPQRRSPRRRWAPTTKSTWPDSGACDSRRGYSIRRQTLRIVAASQVSGFVDERFRREGTPAAEIRPTLPLPRVPIEVPLPQHLREPPEAFERFVHGGVCIRRDVSACGSAQHEFHLHGIDEEAGTDSLLEHPFQRDL